VTKRPQNRCSKCGHTWYPRGSNRSVRCPNCGNTSVSVVGGGALLGALMLIAMGMCSHRAEPPPKAPASALSPVNAQDRATHPDSPTPSEVVATSRSSDRTNAVLPPIRCGWFEQPDPLSATFHDGRGSWVIRVQEDHVGEEHWPKFRDDQWVEVSGEMGYGYGCACLEFQSTGNEIGLITSSRPMPLQFCRVDPTLPSERSLSD
jgi:hypothetical protein